jgi:hypothetical protein
MKTQLDPKAKALLIDAAAMLAALTDHTRPRNWDGSTEGQARATIREIEALLANSTSTYPTQWWQAMSEED